MSNLTKIDFKVQHLPVVNVNGKPCVIVPDEQNHGINLHPLSKAIDPVQKHVPIESKNRYQQSLFAQTMNDPIAALLTGAGLILLTCIIFYIMLPKHGTKDYEVCHPQYFLWIKTDDNCTQHHESY